MSYAEMRRELYAMKREGMIAMGVAHPFNYNSRDLPILNVGLLTATVKTGLELDDVLEFAKACDAVGCWNPTLAGEEMPSKGKVWGPLGRFVTKCLDYHNENAVMGDFWARRDANTSNNAFAEYMKEEFGLGTMFDGDDHWTLPMDYDCGGDIMGMGYTKIVLPGEMHGELLEGGRKPTAKEIVGWIVKRNIKMEGVVHASSGRGGPVIQRVRRIMPDERREMDKDLRRIWVQAYAGQILDDFAYWVGTGQWSAIGNMIG
jgi:hypothetical protein